MRWLCPDELLLLESVEERDRICTEGYTAFIKHWHTWLAFAICVVALALPGLALSEFVKMATQAGHWRVAGIRFSAFVPIICEAMLIPIMFVGYRNWMRTFLRDYLNEHGIPVCRKCGYDLRGQANRTCSECGTISDDAGQ